ARRPRYSARIVKCSTSRYHENDDSRPRLPAAITAIGITMHTPPKAPGAPSRTLYFTRAPRPDQPPTRRQRITEIMTSQPPREWSGHELALRSRRDIAPDQPEVNREPAPGARRGRPGWCAEGVPLKPYRRLSQGS